MSGWCQPRIWNPGRLVALGLAGALLVVLAVSAGVPREAGSLAFPQLPSTGARAPAPPPAPGVALPLAFVPNAGQAGPAALYSASGPGFAFSFTRSEILLSFADGDAGATVGLRFLGAAPDLRVTASEHLPGTVSYLLGDDPALWQSGISTYGAVVYRGVWPGIDMRISGGGGTLKYAFVVHPGASPSDIRLAYRGIDGLSLTAAGSLRLATPLGPLTDSRPVSFQPAGGKRAPVESSYVVSGRSHGFAVGPYDPRRLLVIDPGLEYSTYLGGAGVDQALAGVVVDWQGNAFVAGRTTSPDFPVTAGAFRPVRAGGEDAFVTKLSADGSTVLYSTYLGGGSADGAWDIAMDKGYVYVSGVTGSSDFPTTRGVFQQADPDPAGLDGFVAKLSKDGSELVYSTYLGGSGNDDEAVSLAVSDGSAYLSGETNSPDFPTTPGAYDRTFNGFFDTFVTRLDKRAARLVFSTYLGGSDSDVTQHGLKMGPGGDVYVAGGTKSTDYPTTPGAFQASDPDPLGDDGFVTRLDASGSALVYSTYLGGPSASAPPANQFPLERVFALAVDGKGHAYVTGRSDSTAFPTTPGAFDTTYNGGPNDVIAVKLSADGSALDYSTYLGGTVNEFGHNLAIDARGRAYVTGLTTSPDWPTTAGSFQPVDPDPPPPPAGLSSQDGFVTVLDPSGATLAYSTYLGGVGLDQPFGIFVDGKHGEEVYVTGWTDAPGFPTTAGAFMPLDPHPVLGPTGRDAFVTKLNIGR
jgi:hypothetical protein